MQEVLATTAVRTATVLRMIDFMAFQLGYNIYDETSHGLFNVL